MRAVGRWLGVLALASGCALEPNPSPVGTDGLGDATAVDGGGYVPNDSGDGDGVDGADGITGAGEGKDGTDEPGPTDGVDGDNRDGSDVTDSTETDGTGATDAVEPSDATDGDGADGTDTSDGTDGSDAADGTDGTDATDTTDGTDSTDGLPPCAPETPQCPLLGCTFTTAEADQVARVYSWSLPKPADMPAGCVADVTLNALLEAGDGGLGAALAQAGADGGLLLGWRSQMGGMDELYALRDLSLCTEAVCTPTALTDPGDHCGTGASFAFTPEPSSLAYYQGPLALPFGEDAVHTLDLGNATLQVSPNQWTLCGTVDLTASVAALQSRCAKADAKPAWLTLLCGAQATLSAAAAQCGSACPVALRAYWTALESLEVPPLAPGPL